MINILSIVIVEHKTVIPVLCHRCKHQWNYGGKNTYVATCPHCRTQLSIRKHSVKSKDDKVPQPGQDTTQAQAAGTTALQPGGCNG